MSITLAAENQVQLLSLHDFSLFSLFVENGVVKRLTFVEDGYVSLGIQTDRRCGMTQGVSGSFGLDLIDNLVELEGEVLGENACLLPGQDLGKVILCGERAMSIVGASGLGCKALVEVVHELRQVGIACFPTGDAAQAQFLGQAILNGLDGAFDPAFGLGRVGTDDLDIELLHGPSKLGQGVPIPRGGLIDPKDAVFVAAEGLLGRRRLACHGG